MKKIDAEIELVGRLNKTWERSKDVIELQMAAEAAWGEGNIQTQMAISEYTEKLEALERAQKLQQVAESIGQAFSNAFADIAFSAKETSQILDEMFNMLIQRITQIMIFEPFAQSITAGIQGMFPATVSHGGGPAGVGGHRSVPAGVFAGAPRLHDGLMPNEFATILERGEWVLPKNAVDAMASGRGGGGGTVNITVRAIDAQGTYAFLKQNSRVIASMVLESSQNNHPIRRAQL
jgi:hypothetical protein